MDDKLINFREYTSIDQLVKAEEALEEVSDEGSVQIPELTEEEFSKWLEEYLRKEEERKERLRELEGLGPIGTTVDPIPEPVK